MPRRLPKGAVALKAFAAEVGVSYPAVIDRINRGSLDGRCVGQDAGGRYISDPAEAHRQWKANADPVVVAAARGTDDLDDGEGGDDTGSVKNARLRYLNAKADMAEWERDKLRGELMLTSEHRAILAAAIVPRLTKILGVPTRARQQISTLSLADIEVLDALLREALEGEDDGELTTADLDVLEDFCRERRAELADTSPEPGAAVAPATTTTT